jgi:serine protease Do
MKKTIVILFFATTAGVISSVITTNYLKEKVIHTDINQNDKNQPVIQQVNYTPVSSRVNVDFVEAAEKTINTVVHVKTEFKVPGNNYYFDPFNFFFGNGGYYQPQQPAMASGSGVIISNDGFIVTNNHVIEKAEKIKIVLNNNKEYEATLIGTDPTTDLALLKVADNHLPFITFGNSDEVKIGEWVLAVGNPFNLTSTVTAGIVSAKARNINILNADVKNGHAPIESFIQTDAAVNPGNSGGALVNTAGELIGINTAIKSNTGSFTGYSFAVPVNIVKKVIDDIMEFGMVQRAYIGISIRELDADFVKKEELKTNEGVYISDVTVNGAAEKSGIKSGDVITKIGNMNIKNVPQLQEQLGKFRPGDEIIVTIDRKGNEIELPVKLKNKEGNEDLVKKEYTELTNLLGADFEELTKDEKQKLRIDSGVKISKLYSGKLRSSGINEGFIITKVDKKAVNSYRDIAQVLENKKGGVLIEGVYQNGMKAYYGFGLN